MTPTKLRPARRGLRTGLSIVASALILLVSASAVAQPPTEPAQPAPAGADDKAGTDASAGTDAGADTETAPVGTDEGDKTTPAGDTTGASPENDADDTSPEKTTASDDSAEDANEDASDQVSSDATAFGKPASSQPDEPADKPSPLLTEFRHKIDAGAFLGANLFGDELELGNAYLDDQVPTSAFMLGLRGTYLLIPHLAPSMSLDPSLSVEVEVKLAFSSTEGSTLNMRDSYSSPVLGWRAHAVVSAWNDRKLRPFALLGIGGETAFSDSPFVYSVDTDAALHWGLGATYKLADTYGVRADFRHGITAGRFALAASTVEFHAGFFYRFGFGRSGTAATDKTQEKSDEDLVKQMNDDPDIVVEPLPTPKVEDTDEDGIMDDVDKCPDLAETINQIDDEDGCPELDADNDKLIDSLDQCPNEPEDPDDFQDEDGCPDRDDDGDGRPDTVDECPNEPETLNGFEDENGCPDTIPDDVKNALQPVLFPPRGTQVATLTKPLDGLKAILDAHPSIRLRIVGHADKAEKGAAALSEKRAGAVKGYLVGAGVEATRFETVSQGADKPVSQSRTRFGKARNRRVEFELIPGPATIPDPTAPAAPEDAAGSTTAPAADGTTPSAAPPPAEPTPAAPAETKPLAPAGTKPLAPAGTKPLAPTDARPAAPAETKPAAPTETKPAASTPS